ncbi:MAG TPA: glycosyltransferase family 2 protein [Acidimicrobiia bacterium]|nr:glycosyltransferase family 2 protein [Acidimicrobiia bacterium]
MSEHRLVSIVIPARNEEGNIARLERELIEAIAGLPYQFEIIVVDNHSSDTTPDLVKQICARDFRWRFIRFSRDFTVEASLAAGYRAASGDAIVVLYSDLQDPPSEIPRLLAKWEEGYDVVYGVRTARPGDPKWRNIGVRIAYRLIWALSEVPIPQNAGDFRLISAQVRDALEQCGEYNRYARGLISWLGFRQTGVEYERRPRLAGESKGPFVHTLIFLLTAITSFSLKPLRMFTLLGFALLGVAAGAIPIYIVLWFIGSPPPGLTTLTILVLGGIGFNSLGIGILGEYLGRTYLEVKHRPLFVIEEVVNLDPTGSGLIPQRTPLSCDDTLIARHRAEAR